MILSTYDIDIVYKPVDVLAWLVWLGGWPVPCIPGEYTCCLSSHCSHLVQKTRPNPSHHLQALLPGALMSRAHLPEDLSVYGGQQQTMMTGEGAGVALEALPVSSFKPADGK